jgi:hypothetical protein
MKNLLKLEELFLFGLALFLFSGLDYGWGWFALWFFAPDLSMIGYVMNPRFGAWTYNLIHHKGLSVALYVLGYLTRHPVADVRRDDPARSLQPRPRVGLWLETRRCLPEHTLGEDWEVR